MKISIVTISYNQSEYLVDAIESVINQGHNNFEYIIVDPGSNDGSRDIIENYRGQISSIILDPDNGPADGLNKGFSVATGDIFGFLNSDDILNPGTLASVDLYFSRHPSMDVVSGNSQIIDEDGHIIRRFYSDPFSIFMSAYGASILSQPSTFFRSDIFRKVGGFNEGNKSNWDAELFVDMALAGAKFARIPEFWSQYRVHGLGITGSGKLHDLHQLHRRNIFRKIMKRDENTSDRAIAHVARYARKVLNYRDTMERLRFGPIFKAKS